MIQNRLLKISVLFFGLQHPVFAGTSVVLLSLPNSQDRAGLEMLRPMKGMIRDLYTSALDLLTGRLSDITDVLQRDGPYTFIPRATLADLHRAVSDPTVDSVIYVGHSRPTQTQGTLMEVPAGVVDLNGFDVTPALQAMHPRLRALAIVGCFSSDGVWNQVRKVFSRDRFPDLHISASVSFEDAMTGTRKAVDFVRRIDAIPRSTAIPRPANPLIRPVHLRIRRILTQTAKLQPAAYVQSTTTGRLLGVFPSGNQQAQVQEITIQIPPGQEFQVGSGPSSLYTGNEVEEGNYELSDERWQPMRNPRTGEITEVFSRLYLWNNP